MRFRAPWSKQSHGAQPPRTAIAWVIHFDEPAAVGAFRRLQQEAQGFADVVCVCHGDAPLAGLGSAVLRLSQAEVEGAMSACVIGRAPRTQFAAIRRLAGYDRYWFIEYDVDFSGDWARFFSEFELCTADLLGTTLTPRGLEPDWWFWPTFQAPAAVQPELHTRGFFPVVRVSRRFVEVFQSEVAHGWLGHYEALYPTIARARGLSIEDIGGLGPFTPPARRGRLYTNTPGDHRLYPGSFRFRPPVSDAYFTPGSTDYPEPERLWHPVKTPLALSLETDPGRM